MPRRLLEVMHRKSGETEQDHEDRRFQEIVGVLIEIESAAKDDRAAHSQDRAEARKERAQMLSSIKCLSTGFKTYAEMNDKRWQMYQHLLDGQLKNDGMWKNWWTERKLSLAKSITSALLWLAGVGSLWILAAWLTKNNDRVEKLLSILTK